MGGQNNQERDSHEVGEEGGLYVPNVNKDVFENSGTKQVNTCYGNRDIPRIY